MFALGLLVVAVVGGVGLVAAQDGESDGETNSTDVPAPETKGYTVEELEENGPLPSSDADPSLRQRGKYGSWWLVHTPMRPLKDPSERGDREYIKPSTVVERDHVHLGTFRGWDAEKETVEVHVVTWHVEEVEVEAGQNRTVTRRKPVNVTEKTVNVTLAAGGRPESKVQLPEHHGEPKFVTMWVAENPDTWRWTFQYSASKAAEEVPLSTRGGLSMYLFVWGGLPFVAVSALMIGVNKHALKKAVRVPDAALLELGLVAVVVLFFAGFVFYHGTLETLAIAPWSIGVVGGLVVGVMYLFAFGQKDNEALALQFSATDASARPDGSGVWRVPNRTFNLHERDDGQLVAARDGWRAFIARAWPFADVTAEVEIDGDPEMLLKGDENSEYSDVFVIDPEAAEVIEKDLESWTVSVPKLVSWPTDEEGNRRPLPSVAWGPLVATVAACGVVYYATVGLLQNGALAAVGVCVVLLVAVTKPTPATLRLDLAPFHYGSVLENLIKHREEYDEKADAEHFQQKFYQEKAKSDAKRKRDRERADKTVFAELNDELSGRSDDDGDRGDRPDAVPTPTTSEPEEVSADD